MSSIMSSILNKARRTGIVECQRSREEQAAVIYADRKNYDWLFWHLQMSRLAALDAGESPTCDWVMLLDRALAALRTKDFAELNRACTHIDDTFNAGREQAAELRREENAFTFGRYK